MAQKKARKQLAVVTTGAALVVLMAGPASTLGLGVPVVGGSDGAVSEVTQTTQAVVDSTQQTAASTVTTVETTVQATVQPTAAPVTTGVQNTTQAVTAAPKQTVSRAAAPVQKKTSTASARRARVTRPAAVRTRRAVSLATPVREASRKTATLRSHARTLVRRPSAAPESASTDSPATASQCDSLSILGLLPGTGELQAILSVVCNAAVPILLPGRIGVAGTGSSPDAGGAVLGTGTRGGSPLRARAASAGGGGPTAVAGHPVAENAAASGRPGASLPSTLSGSAAGRSGAAGAQTGAGTGAGSTAGTNAASAGPHHHAWFSGSSKGTQALIAILILNMAILAGIAMWRLAVRWVIPRFA